MITELISLEKLFQRHYVDGVLALRRFKSLLLEANLSFNVFDNITEFIPASTADGMLSTFSYFIPRAKYGINQKLPLSPDDPSHNNHVDGVGLNRGCPIRLARALDVLFSLPESDRRVTLAELKSPCSHIACVEELLWLTIWKNPSGISRGRELSPIKGRSKQTDIDWFLMANETPIDLEVKYRPTDWLRKADPQRMCISRKFFREIGKKFPSELPLVSRCISAITGFAEPFNQSPFADATFANEVDRKLREVKSLHALLYKSLLGPIYVFSHEDSVATEIASMLEPTRIDDWPAWYKVTFNRSALELKGADLEKGDVKFPDNLACLVVDRLSTRKFQAPALPDRHNLQGIAPKTGEPTFVNVPAFLPPKSPN